MMKKILIILGELFCGGAEKQFREIIRRINKDKYTIVVVVGGYVSIDNHIDNAAKKYEADNPEVKFYYLNDLSVNRGFPYKIKSMLSFRKQIKPILHDEKPDCVLFYNGIELMSSYLYKAIGAKVIFSERESGNRGRLKMLRNKILFRPVSKLTCNSLAAQRYYRENNLEFEYIPNGIEVSPKLPPMDSEIFCIVVPARIVKVKNQEVVIKAVSKIKNVKFNVIFIGKHESKEYLEYLQTLSSKYNLNDNIEFIGFTDDIKSIYNMASLIVLPTLMEGFTNILLESYMYGRMCLVSDIPMNRDVAAASQRFFSPNDPDELYKLILDVMNMSSEKKAEEIEANYSYVVNSFSVETMVSNYEKMFDDVLNVGEV